MSSLNTQYTIRGVLPEVDRTLRKLAKERHVSLNRFLVDQLQLIAENSNDKVSYSDLDFAIGTLQDDDALEEALKSFSVIDEDAWK